MSTVLYALHNNIESNVENDVESTDEWYLDSGATAHMCNNSDLFTYWKSKRQSSIHTAGNHIINSLGIGSVTIRVMLNGKITKLTLNDVLYVPKLKYNLISISKATENNHKITFNKYNAFINNHENICVLKAKKVGKLYSIKPIRHSSLLTEHKENSELIKWHQRLGHLNFYDILKLKQNNLIKDFPDHLKSKKIQCVICDKAKMSQKPFHKSEREEKDTLDIVHSDICGPMSVKSIGGARYFVTFIDGKSRYTEVSFLKSRSEVLDAFKKYQTQVERQTGKRIKCLRTDNAKEYLSKEFNDYLDKQGIRRELSVQYTPQQNGIAERANRTLMEMARCMLFDADLPKSLWAEAVNTAAYVRNRCPSSAIGSKTPFELWFGKKPKINYFRSFGSKAIALYKGPKKSKLDPKGEECIFVGYCSDSKAYRLWNGDKSIIKRRDVRFYERTNLNNYLFLEVKPAKAERKEIDEKELKENDDDDNNIFPVSEEEIINSDETRENVEKNNHRTEEESETSFHSIPDTARHSASSNEEICSDISSFHGFDLTSESEAEENEAKTTKATNKGRPRIIRTGKRGRPRKAYKDQVNLTITDPGKNPISIKEAINSNDSKKWLEAMESELESLRRNDTWSLVDRPKNEKVLTNKWIFSIKNSTNGPKYKARLVARGCEQEDGIDYNEIYAPVARYETLRVLFALCAEYELLLHQMDFVTAFVQGDLEDTIYMEQPLHPTKEIDRNKVCKLNRPIYGLKQASRQWHKRLDTYLKQIGLKQIMTDQCLYVKTQDSKLITILIYVDDILLASNSKELLSTTKSLLSDQFEMKDLGEVNNILGFDVKRNSSTGSIQINQRKYIEQLLKRFNMTNANAISTPMESNLKPLQIEEPISEKEKEEVKSKPFRELIGALTYLSNTTRPDIAFAVNFLARFNQEPRLVHWAAAKRILRYLIGTKDYSIKYEKSDKHLEAYSDSDWGNDTADRKSCSGYILMMSKGPICWKSKKQRCTALSTMEAEYIALSEVVKEVMYLRNLLSELGFKKYCTQQTSVYCDNQSSVNLCNNYVNNSKSKHVDIRYHFCKEKQDSGHIKVAYIPSAEMPADMFTKSLCRTKFKKCIELTRLNCN